jgi:hypothetical protein
MDDYKTLLTSKTFWGAIIAGVAGLAGAFGHNIPAGDQQDIVNQVSAGAGAAFTVIGAALAIYGRIKAEKKIGKPQS